MKEYTFRITQPLVAFYEAEVTIEAKSEKDARNKLNKMSNEEITEYSHNWEQNTDNADPDGDIEIHELIN